MQSQLSMVLAPPSAHETGVRQLRGSEKGLSSPLRTEAAIPLEPPPGRPKAARAPLGGSDPRSGGAWGPEAGGGGDSRSGGEQFWLVVCLCAQWCRVCEQYRQGFEDLAASYPQTRFLWLDIEDRDDVAGDLDIETFPSLLIADPQHARFLGPLLPQLPVLSRLLRSLQSVGSATDAVSDQAQALRERILAAGLV